MEGTLANIRHTLKKQTGLIYFGVCSVFNAACVGDSDTDRLLQVLQDTKEGVLNVPYKREHRRFGNMYFFTELAIRRLIEDNGFSVQQLEWFRNQDFPNGHSNDKYAENICLIASKK
jgi:hypothetical protein